MSARRRGRLRACLTLLAGLLGAAACLPEDDTPAPGTATFLLRGSPDGATLPPFEDGWTVTVTRAFLLASRSFQSDPLCDLYSESRFEPALVNVIYQGDAPLGSVRGLGPCRTSIVPGGLLEIARLGPGVTEGDRATVSAAVGAAGELGSGAALFVEATAARGDLVRTLSLVVPAQGLFLACPQANGDPSYTLRSGEPLTMVISYDLSRVFADAPLPGGRLRLTPFLRADEEGNRDGHVTPDELDNVELSSYGQLGYDLAGFSPLRPLTPLLTHWVTAMATQGYLLDGRRCAPSGFPGLGGLE